MRDNPIAREYKTKNGERSLFRTFMASSEFRDGHGIFNKLVRKIPKRTFRIYIL